MCGKAFHARDQYLPKLIQVGHRVAICEQTEDPKAAKKRGGSKAAVNRDVVRILTPAPTEDTFLEGKANFLASFAIWVDVARPDGFGRGRVFVQALPSNFNKTHMEALLAEIDPGEILAADILATHEALGGLFQGLGHR